MIITQLFKAVETLGENYPITNGTAIIQSNNLGMHDNDKDNTIFVFIAIRFIQFFK